MRFVIMFLFCAIVHSFVVGVDTIPVTYSCDCATNAYCAEDQIVNCDVAADNLGSDILDIRPLENWNSWWRTNAFLLTLLAILLIFLFFIIRKVRGNRSSGSGILPQSPYELAVGEIESARIIMSEKNQKMFAVIVSDAVRKYMSVVFGLPAPEYTTDEVLEKIREEGMFSDEFVEEIRPFLQSCDLAKFTEQIFNLAELDAIYNNAHGIVLKADKLRQSQQMAATNDVKIR